MIPIFDYLRDFERHREEYLAACERVFRSGRLILGDEVAAFEQEFANQVGASHAVGVNSGTDALALALLAVGVEAGDEVVLPAFTAPATAAAVVDVGAIPRFVEVTPQTMTLCPDAVESALTPRTRAVIAVHLYGCPAAIESLAEITVRRGIPLLEDCAQGHGTQVRGRQVGTFGQVGCFSFYPTKNLGAFGDAGACVTNDPQLAKRLRQWRHNGMDAMGMVQPRARNSRMDELQAALLRVKLRRLEEYVLRRRALAAEYRQGLRNLDMDLPPEVPGHAYHLFVIRSRTRQTLVNALTQHTIGCAIHYPKPLHRMPAFGSFVARGAQLIESERAANEVLSLPMFPELESREVNQICSVLTQHLRIPYPMASSTIL